MSPDGDVYQIAFMVDLQSYKKHQGNEYACQKVANEIRLSSLKLLTHFCQSASQTKTSSQNLRWGYTFYNSCSLAAPHFRSDFKEFNLKYFENFENDVEDKLENEKAMEEGSIAKGCRTGAEAVKYGLMDLSNDFPWGRPEIMSPVRPTRQKKGPRNNQGWNNISFIFSSCPQTKSDVGKFTCGSATDNGIQPATASPTVKDMLSKITTPHLLREICNSKRIQIFWIDLADCVEVFEEDVLLDSSQFGLKLFDDVLHHFCGRVVPLRAILQLGSSLSSHHIPFLDSSTGADNQEKDSTHHNSIVPFSSLADHFIKNLSPNLSNSVTAKQPSTLLVFTTDNGHRMCPLETSCIMKGGMSLPQRLCGEKHRGKSKDTKPTVMLGVCGMLNRSRLLLECLSNTDVFLCSSGSSQKDDVTLFSSLLNEMAKQNSVLVVDFSSSSRPLCWRAIIQPLTSGSATLTVVKPDYIIFIEKLLSSKLLTSEDVNHEDLSSFMERTVKHFVDQVPSSDKVIKREDPTPSGIGGSDTRMVSSILEPWFQQGCRQSAVKSMMESLKDGTCGPGVEEVSTIRLLQRLYRGSCIPDPPRMVNHKDGQKQDLDDVDGMITAAAAKSSQGAPSRADKIINESMKLQTKRKSDNSPSKEEKREGCKAGRMEVDRSLVDGKDFKDDDDLVCHLKEHYEKVLSDDLQPVQFAQMTFMIAFHYFKASGRPDPQEGAVSLLNSTILMNDKTLKEKYKTMDIDKDEKIREYKAQILLHMECESFFTEVEEVVNEKRIKEVAKMLRSMNLLSDDGSSLHKFLNQVLLENFAPTIPRSLSTLYDELMQPLPESLPQLFSPSSMSDEEKPIKSVSSVRSASSVRSESLFSDDSMDPWSVRTRSRKIARYSSVGDMGGTSKQIMVPIARQKSHRSRSGKQTKKEKLARTTSSSAIPIVVPETEIKQDKDTDADSGDVKKVRRNLFTGGGLSAGGSRLLERRQSVAVMENMAHHSHSPHKKRVLKTQVVAETPVHKQVSRSLRQKDKIEKLARRMSEQSAVMVVEESPEKPVRKAVRKSPRRLSLAPALTQSQSFYSGHPSKKSRNVEKYKSATCEFKSPDKLVAERAKTFLFAQFGSPSPTRSVAQSPIGTPRRSPRLFSPDKDEVPGVRMSPRLTPRRSSGVKKRLLGLMRESPRKTPVKSTYVPSTPTRPDIIDSAVTPKKTLVMVPGTPVSCSKTPQRVLWSEPIEMGPHTPKKTPQKPILSAKKKVDLSDEAPPAYFTRGRTPKKNSPEATRKNLRSTPKKDLFGSFTASKEIPGTPGKTVAFEPEITTPKRVVDNKFCLQAPVTPRSILKSRSAISTTPVSASKNRRVSKLIFADPDVEHGPGMTDNPEMKYPAKSANVDTKSENLIKTPVGAKRKFQAFSPGLFGDDWGKTTPEKFGEVNLDGILPLLGNSPIVSKPADLVGGVTPDKVKVMSVEVTPDSKVVKKTPDSFDKWKRTKRRNSVQSPVKDGLNKGAGDSVKSLDEDIGVQVLKRKVRRRKSQVSPQEELPGWKKAIDDCRSTKHRTSVGDFVRNGTAVTTCGQSSNPAFQVADSMDSVVLLTPSSTSAKAMSFDEVDSGKKNNKKTKRAKQKGKKSAPQLDSISSPVVEGLELSPELVYTPQRFTRGLSKETGLSTQQFISMSTKSPHKSLSSPAVSSTRNLSESSLSGKRKWDANVDDSDCTSEMLTPMDDMGRQHGASSGTPSKRRRVHKGGQNLGPSSHNDSPASHAQSISSQVSCADYFSSENEEVFLTSTDEQFKYIDETTCGFGNDAFTREGRKPKERETNLDAFVPFSQYSGSRGSESNGSSTSRRPRSSARYQSFDSRLSENSRLSLPDEESREALSIMSENFLSPRKASRKLPNLDVVGDLPASPSHHRVEALRKMDCHVSRSSSQSKSLVDFDLSTVSPSGSGNNQQGFRIPSPQPPTSEQVSPKNPLIPKKCSPNITAKALSHLLQSPILKTHEDMDLGLMAAEVNQTEKPDEIQSTMKSEMKRSSRRSLYRTKTKSNISD